MVRYPSIPQDRLYPERNIIYLRFISSVRPDLRYRRVIGTFCETIKNSAFASFRWVPVTDDSDISERVRFLG